jgi:hypothetical protein
VKIKTILVAALMLIALNLLAGGGVKFVKTWKNPDAQPGSWKGKKVAAFVMTLLNDARQGAEQALARELTQRGAQGVPGYTIVPREAEKDRVAAKRILADAGITGAVLMQVVDVQQDIVATSAQSYYTGPNVSTFTGFWDYGWGMVYTPGTVDAKTTVMVETLIYSIDQDKLVWAGTSKTTNPDKVGEVIKKLAGAVGSEVKKAGLIAK